MLKFALIEDEKPARKRLLGFIRQYQPEAVITGEADTVEGVTELLRQPDKPDLILSDIELLNGNVFEAFDQIPPPCPVIFTTAYDQFWMQAFQHNGIEYLLKPFTYERFEQSMKKYTSLQATFAQSQAGLLQQLSSLLTQKGGDKTAYKKRFTVKKRDGIYFLETEKIVFIQAEGGVIKAVDATGETFFLNETSLQELELKLPPDAFFRINRSELVNRQYIKKIDYYTKDRLSVYFTAAQTVLYTSQSRTAEFRQWMES